MFACLNCKENFQSPDIFGGLHVCPFCTSRMVNTREEYQIVRQCLDEYRKKRSAPCSSATETGRKEQNIQFHYTKDNGISQGEFYANINRTSGDPVD